MKSKGEKGKRGKGEKVKGGRGKKQKTGFFAFSPLLARRK
jgi:hypothetical protein